MRGLCDAPRCREHARWYAVARGSDFSGLAHRYGLNFSACDHHRGTPPLELARVAGWDGMVNNLLANMPASIEVLWEHIGGT